MKRKFLITKNTIIQIGLVFFSVGGLLLISMKLPEYGLIMNLISQMFWLHSSYKAWKEANQIGLFINTVLFTIITIYGIVNYWFLN
ncbi:hypothetical protein HOO68_04280 [Candidatus Gracilibacteria bacterium]|nr:hypothetical protein [Candidatus Gracilibacteria bacterium]